jgi:hypothetical protein
MWFLFERRPANSRSSAKGSGNASSLSTSAVSLPKALGITASAAMPTTCRRKHDHIRQIYHRRFLIAGSALVTDCLPRIGLEDVPIRTRPG